MKRIVALAVAALLAVSLQAAAAGPTDTAPGTSGSPARTNVRSGFAGASETTITGMVVDEAGQPQLDVAVKLYMGGLLVNEQPTSSDGSFEFTELIDYGRDITIDLWFVPPSDDLVMENVILKESSSALQHAIYSPCVQRSRLDPITDVIVKLYTLEGRLTRLKQRGCVD